MPHAPAVPHTPATEPAADRIERALDRAGILTAPQLAAATGLAPARVHTVAARLVQRGVAVRVARGIYAHARTRGRQEPLTVVPGHEAPQALFDGPARVLERAGVQFSMTGWAACGPAWEPSAHLVYVPSGDALRAAVALGRSRYRPLVNPAPVVLGTTLRCVEDPSMLVVLRVRSLAGRSQPVCSPQQGLVDLLAEHRRGLPIDEDDLALALWRIGQLPDPAWRGMVRLARRRGVPLSLDPSRTPPIGCAPASDEKLDALLSQAIVRSADPFADLLDA